jgi:hypothetical protein
MLSLAAALVLGLQDPFPEPGKVNKQLKPAEQVYYLLIGEPSYSSVSGSDSDAAHTVLDRLKTVASYKLDDIESGMIETLELAPFSAKRLGLLSMLDALDEVVFDVPKPLHLTIGAKGEVRLEPYTLRSSGSPIQPITRFRELRKHYGRRKLPKGEG